DRRGPEGVHRRLGAAGQGDKRGGAPLGPPGREGVVQASTLRSGHGALDQPPQSAGLGQGQPSPPHRRPGDGLLHQGLLALPRTRLGGDPRHPRLRAPGRHPHARGRRGRRGDADPLYPRGHRPVPGRLGQPPLPGRRLLQARALHEVLRRAGHRALGPPVL
ncbi:MAG: 2,4'-dihydroxyacetophenone dioxygenase, partial [uncultured Rubrobacteraceae bacterium]